MIVRMWMMEIIQLLMRWPSPGNSSDLAFKFLHCSSSQNSKSVRIKKQRKKKGKYKMHILIMLAAVAVCIPRHIVKLHFLCCLWKHSGFKFRWPRSLNNLFNFASWRENLWQNHATYCHKIYWKPGCQPLLHISSLVPALVNVWHWDCVLHTEYHLHYSPANLL